MKFIALSLAAVFSFLAGLHIYWGLGGRWASESALPRTTGGELVFKPGLLGCLVVAGGLGGFAYLCLAHAALLPRPAMLANTHRFLAGMSVIFALRVVGDFRYVGVFRRIKETDFAVRDRSIYTPLCAVLSAVLALLAAA